MKKHIILPLLATILLFGALRWQGSSLVTPQSPGGIIDLEFARTPEHLSQMLLFWDRSDVKTNIYLDFLFIIAYVWLLTTVTRVIKARGNWAGAATFFSRLAIFAGMLDVLENLLMLEAINMGGRTATLKMTFYIAAAKFIFLAVVLLYILISLVIIFRNRRRLPN